MASLLVQRLAGAKTPAQRSAATKMLNRYIQKRVSEGCTATGVLGAVKASVTKLKSRS